MKALWKLVSFSVLAVLILTACASPATPPDEPVVVTAIVKETTVVTEKGDTIVVTATPETVAPPDKVSLWSPCIGADSVPNWDYDPILQTIETATNTDITIVPGQWGMDQINQYVAGGDLPDIIGVQGPEAMPVLKQFVRDGVIAPFEGAVGEAAPNLLEDYESNPALVEMKVDGNIYFQPVGWGDGLYPNMGLMHVRKDLLDKYGMEPPNTFDEYFEYIKTCTAKGDGKGVISNLQNGVGPNLSAFAGAYGLPMRDFTKTADGYGYFAAQPAILDALLLFRQMEDKNLIAPESYEGVDALEAYMTGQYCGAIFNGGGHTGRVQNALEAIDPAMKNWMLPALTVDGNTRGYTQEPMFWGTAQIGNMENNNPEAAARVINYMISDEGYKLTAIGIEGRDYEVKDGEYVILPQRTKDNFPVTATDTGSHPLAGCIVSWVPQELQDWALLYGHDQAWKDWYKQMWTNQGMYQVPTYGSLTTTPLWDEFLATNNDLMNIAFLEIIKAPTEDAARARYEQFVSDWKAAGGEEAQAEMSAKLVELYGK
jgi:putative aldouronate transport system substrate-binding protein